VTHFYDYGIIYNGETVLFRGNGTFHLSRQIESSKEAAGGGREREREKERERERERERVLVKRHR